MIVEGKYESEALQKIVIFDIEYWMMYGVVIRYAIYQAILQWRDGDKFKTTKDVIDDVNNDIISIRLNLTIKIIHLFQFINPLSSLHSTFCIHIIYADHIVHSSSLTLNSNIFLSFRLFYDNI